MLHRHLSNFVPCTHWFKILPFSNTKCLYVLSLCSANHPDSIFYTQSPFPTTYSPLKPLCSDCRPHGATNLSLTKLIIRLLIAKACGCFSGLFLMDLSVHLTLLAILSFLKSLLLGWFCLPVCFGKFGGLLGHWVCASSPLLNNTTVFSRGAVAVCHSLIRLKTKLVYLGHSGSLPPGICSVPLFYLLPTNFLLSPVSLHPAAGLSQLHHHHHSPLKHKPVESFKDSPS